MSTSTEDRPLYGKAIGVGLAGLAGLAAEGVLVAPAKAVSTYDLKAAKKIYDAPDPSGYMKLGVTVAAGDLDGDGRADLVAGGTDGSSDLLTYWKFSPNAGISFEKQDFIPRALGLPPSSAGVRVATGDLNGDGLPDLVVGEGGGSGSGLRAGGGPYLKITLKEVMVSSYAQPQNNGVHAGAADFDGDGQAEIYAGPSGSPGAPSVVRRISMSSSKGASGDITSYMKFTDEFAVYGSSYTGGIRVATGDVNGDGSPDLVTMQEAGTERHINYGKIKVEIGAAGQRFHTYDKASPVLARSFTVDASPPECLAVGDLDGDGRADLVIGSAPGAAPSVSVFSLQTVADGGPEADAWVPRPDLSLTSTDLFTQFGSSYTGGVNVAVGDVTGDGFADLIVGNASFVPEPATLASLVIGSSALLARRRRRAVRPPTAST